MQKESRKARHSGRRGAKTRRRKMIGCGHVKKICGCFDEYCKCAAASDAIVEEEHKRKLRSEIKQLFGKRLGNFLSSKTTNKNSGQRHDNRFDNRYYLNLVDNFSGIIYDVTKLFKRKSIGPTKKKQIKQMMNDMVKEIPYSLKSDEEIQNHLESLNKMLDPFTTEIYPYLTHDEKQSISQNIEDMKRYIKRAIDKAIRTRLELDLETMEDILRTINTQIEPYLYLPNDKYVKTHLQNAKEHIREAIHKANINIIKSREQ